MPRMRDQQIRPNFRFRCVFLHAFASTVLFAPMTLPLTEPRIFHINSQQHPGKQSCHHCLLPVQLEKKLMTNKSKEIFRAWTIRGAKTEEKVSASTFHEPALNKRPGFIFFVFFVRGAYSWYSCSDIDMFVRLIDCVHLFVNSLLDCTTRCVVVIIVAECWQINKTHELQSWASSAAPGVHGSYLHLHYCTRPSYPRANRCMCMACAVADLYISAPAHREQEHTLRPTNGAANAHVSASCLSHHCLF